MTTDLRVLGRAVKQAQWRHHRSVDRLLAPLGSSTPQWDALRAIDANPNASAHDLAEITFQSDQAFGTLANRLIAHGLVERSPGRGRRVVHRLTGSGQALLEKAQAAVDAFLAESFADLDEPERRVLLGLLERVAAVPPSSAPARSTES